ncbi:hypothetical protein ABK040_000733 [Willaertia magna]
MLSQHNTQLNPKEIYEKFFKQTLHYPLQKVFELKEKTDIKRDFYWEHSFSMDEKVYVKVWETSYKGAGKHPNPGFFKNLPGTLFEVISDSLNNKYFFKLGDELYYNEAEKDIKEEDDWKIRTCDSIYFTILVVRDGKVVCKPNFFLLAAKKKHNLITMTNDNVFITEQKHKNKFTNKSMIKRATLVEVEKEELSTTTVDSKKKKRKQKKSKHKKEENFNEYKLRKLDNSTGNQLENSFYHNESSSPVPLPQSCGSNTSSSTAFTTDEFDPVNDNKPLSSPMHQPNIKDHHCLEIMFTNSEDIDLDIFEDYSSLCTTSPTLPPLFNTDPGYFDFREGIDTSMGEEEQDIFK